MDEKKTQTMTSRQLEDLSITVVAPPVVIPASNESGVAATIPQQPQSRLIVFEKVVEK
jgi:hypothetical protein